MFDVEKARASIERETGAVYLCVQLSGALDEIDRLRVELARRGKAWCEHCGSDYHSEGWHHWKESTAE